MVAKTQQKLAGNFLHLLLRLLLIAVIFVYPLIHPLFAWSEDFCPTSAEIEQAKKLKEEDLLESWLLHAVEESDKDSSLPCVKRLLTAGVNPNAQFFERSALDYVLDNGEIEIAKTLIAAGADINAKAGEKSTFQRIAESGDLDLMKQAFARGAALPPEAGAKTLEIAIHKGRLDIVKLLIAKGVDPKIKSGGDDASLLVAAAAGNPEVFHYFLNLGFPINNKPIDKGENSLIHAAAAGGNIEIIKEVIKKGANPNLLAKNKDSPLTIAVKQGKADAVRFLLKNGSYDRKVSSDEKLVQSAVSSGNLDVLQALLDAGASVDFKNPDIEKSLNNAVWSKKSDSLELFKYGLAHGANPEKLLAAALSTDHVEFVKALKDHGVDFKKSVDGRPVLNQAIYLGASLPLLEYLMSLGIKADEVLYNDRLGTPAGSALSTGRLKIVEFLAKRAGLEKAQDKKDFWLKLTGAETFDGILESAISPRNLGLVEFLVKNGVNVDKNDVNSTQFLEEALQRGDRAMLEFLLKQGFKIPENKGLRQKLISAAASSGKLDLLKFIESKGLQISEMGAKKDILLFRAIYGGVDTTKYLIAKGCNPKSKDGGGWSLLYNLACNRNTDLIKFLIENGADINEENPEGTTFLQRLLSCSNADVGFLRYLRQHGADFTSKHVAGQGLLEIVARSSANKEFFDFILHSGLDPREKSRQGRSAVFGAVCSNLSSRSEEIDRIKLLARYDAKGLKTTDDDGATLLHYAASCNNAKVIEFLLKAGLNPSAEDKNGHSPLYSVILSSWSPRTEATALLLKAYKNATKDTRKFNSELTSLLMTTAGVRNDNTSIIHMLVKAGADLNARDSDGMTPLHKAVSSAWIENVQALLNDGAHFDAKESRSFLSDAIRSGSPAMLQFIISRGKADLDAPDADGVRPLLQSLNQFDLDMAKTLIEAGAKVDFKVLQNLASTINNNKDESLLHFAVFKLGQWHAVKLLHDAGARFESEEDYWEALSHTQNTQLFKYLMENFKEYPLTQNQLSQLLADGAENPEILQYLFDKGAQPNNINAAMAFQNAARAGATDSIRIFLTHNTQRLDSYPENTPFAFLAAASGHVDAVKLLLNDKKLLTALDYEKKTILSYAVTSQNVDLVKDLVRQGADLKAKEPSGQSLLFNAVMTDYNDGEIVDYLLQNGLDPNDTPKTGNLPAYLKGQTPLHAAATTPYSNPKEPVITALVKAGAHINAQDSNGDTPLHLALRSNMENNALKLIELGADLSIRNHEGFSCEDLIRRSNDPRLVATVKAIDDAKLEKVKKRWDDWIKNQDASSTEGELVESLLSKLDDKKFPPPPPAKASDRIKKIYKALKAARLAPESLTSQSLELDDMPPAYYREILKGASTIRAQSASQTGKPYVFNPSPDQARNVVNIMLSDPKVSEADLQALAWLLVRSRVNLDADLLDRFKMDEKKLKNDVDQMLSVEPMQYKGSSSFAALKLIKSLLSYSDEDFACGSSGDIGGSALEPKISRILNWFGNYGNNVDADRVFFSKLARLILAKKKLCSRDRDILLNAMRDWKGSNALVQHEIACAVAQSMGSAPLSSRLIEEFTLISDTVGLRSELNPSSWLEQMRAFGELLSHHGGGALSGDEQEIYNGLLKFVLGNPEGTIQKDQKKFFSFPKSEPNPGQIVKLCQILKRRGRDKGSLSEADLTLASGASLWLQVAREHLNSARSWPEGFVAQGFNTQQTLRQEFSSDPRLASDLTALESSCQVLPHGDGTPESYLERSSRIKAQKQPRRRTSNGSFDFTPTR